MTLVTSDALVFFGATGDLAYKQIFPALHHMVSRGVLNTPVIGVAKSDWTLDDLRKRARASVDEHGIADEPAFRKLMDLLHYIDGDYTDPTTFDRLREALGAAQHPTHYLAIPPSLFALVINELGRSSCADGARVVIEKPFGHDTASAIALNDTVHQVFSESAIFRIDHYLGKDAVENIMYFRFANTFLEPMWSHHYIDSIEITMAENFGIKGRGKFYDETGAIRDVIQNHLLQVVTLLAMEPPWSISEAEAIRDEQVKVLHTVVPLQPSDVVRGQFRGYRDEPGVAPESQVETYAAVRLCVESWRWRGVPFLIRVGKQLPITMTQVRVNLKAPPLVTLAGRPNFIRFRLGPLVSISIGAEVKDFRQEGKTDSVELSMVRRPDPLGQVDAYEGLLSDAMHGVQTRFVREDAVLAQWRIVEAILGNATPLHSYDPGTWGPAEAQGLAADLGGWHNPHLERS